MAESKQLATRTISLEEAKKFLERLADEDSMKRVIQIVFDPGNPNIALSMHMDETGSAT
jgi:hypothetical protein